MHDSETKFRKDYKPPPYLIDQVSYCEHGLQCISIQLSPLEALGRSCCEQRHLGTGWFATGRWRLGRVDLA